MHGAYVSVTEKPAHWVTRQGNRRSSSGTTQCCLHAASSGCGKAMVLLLFLAPASRNLALRKENKWDHSPGGTVILLGSRVSPEGGMGCNSPRSQAETGLVALNASNKTNLCFQSGGRGDEPSGAKDSYWVIPLAINMAYTHCLFVPSSWPSWENPLKSAEVRGGEMAQWMGTFCISMRNWVHMPRNHMNS